MINLVKATESALVFRGRKLSVSAQAYQMVTLRVAAWSCFEHHVRITCSDAILGGAQAITRIAD